MPKLPTTDRGIDAVRPAPRRTEYWDPKTPGLTLRVSPDGVKSWALMYRRGPRRRRLTLGRYPDLSLAKARERARVERGRITTGADPAAEKQHTRVALADSFGALFDDYAKRRGPQRRRWSEMRRAIEVDVLPTWRNKALKDVRRADVRALIEKKAETAPVMANRLLAYISTLFSYALECDLVEFNPCLRITKQPERPRDRTLTTEELRELWQALHETSAKDQQGRALPRLTAVMNDAFRVLLLTAQRLGEVAQMRWADLDLKGGWWTIPGRVTKNGDDHRVPLTEPVLAILKRRAKAADRDETYVFSTQPGSSIRARAAKAAAILSKRPEPEVSGLSFAFRAHDLRRTAASGMAAAGIPRDHIAHVLNHRTVTKGSITAVYDRYQYDREKKAALEAWAQHVTAGR